MAKTRSHSTTTTTDPTVAEPGRASSGSHRSALAEAIRAERESTLGLAVRRATIADAAVAVGLARLGSGPVGASAGADLLGLTATYTRPTEAEITTRAYARVEAGKATDLDTEIHRIRLTSERRAIRATASMALGGMVDALLRSED